MRLHGLGGVGGVVFTVFSLSKEYESFRDIGSYDRNREVCQKCTSRRWVLGDPI